MAQCRQPIFLHNLSFICLIYTMRRLFYIITHLFQIVCFAKRIINFQNIYVEAVSGKSSWKGGIFVSGIQVHGLRSFLLTILMLITSGEKVSVSYVEDGISNGIASTLSKKYEVFAENGFGIDSWKAVDTYYRDQWSGCADGQENRTYGCSESDGLPLLIALALNEFL